MKRLYMPLIYIAASDTAHYSSINTSTKNGCRTFEALMTNPAEHYGTKKEPCLQLDFRKCGKQSV